MDAADQVKTSDTVYIGIDINNYLAKTDMNTNNDNDLVSKRIMTIGDQNYNATAGIQWIPLPKDKWITIHVQYTNDGQTQTLAIKT